MYSLLGQCDQELHTLVAASAVHIVALVHQSCEEKIQKVYTFIHSTNPFSTYTKTDNVQVAWQSTNNVMKKNITI